jgi:enamine deaminase RidA (YjgF/YER057c/UK114 family)
MPYSASMGVLSAQKMTGRSTSSAPAPRIHRLPSSDVGVGQTTTMDVERRLEELGLVLPAAATFPAGIEIPFSWVRLRGDRGFIAGHGALNVDGSPTGPFGQVPGEVSLEDAQQSARLAGLAILSSLKDALGDLDRIAAWLTVSGYINAEPGYAQTTAVINPVSELIVDLYGANAGTHARTAIGVAALPLNLPVVIAAEVEIERT